VRKSYRTVWEKTERAKVEGLVSNRVFLVLARCYLYGYLTGSLEHYTDEDFLTLPELGPKTLLEIRRAIPSPVK